MTKRCVELENVDLDIASRFQMHQFIHFYKSKKEEILLIYIILIKHLIRKRFLMPSSTDTLHKCYLTQEVL